MMLQVRRFLLFSAIGAIVVVFWCAGVPPAAAQAPMPAEAPAGATDAVAAATAEGVTGSMALDMLDRGTDDLVESVSMSLDVARTATVDALGGEAALAGRWADRGIRAISIDIAGRPLWLYLLSLALILLGLAARHFLVRRLVALLDFLARRSRTTLDDALIEALAKPMRFAVVLLVVYVGVRVLFAGGVADMESTVAVIRVAWRLFQVLVYLATLFTIAWALVRVVDVAIDALHALAARRGTQVDRTFVPLLRRTVKIFIWAVAALQALAFLQFDTLVTSLLAAGGVGALAVGLAAQDTLKNFFGSVVLMIDRPFSVGDWIVAGDTEGVVEQVGVRSTKIRTFAKTLVTVPNSQIVDRDINNFTRMPVRRVFFTLGVTYETTADQMCELVARIDALLEQDEGVWKDFKLVRFTEFGDSSLNLMLYFFTSTTVWADHLDIVQRVNLQIMRIVDELGLEIAFPTRTVYLRQESNDKPTET